MAYPSRERSAPPKGRPSGNRSQGGGVGRSWLGVGPIQTGKVVPFRAGPSSKLATAATPALSITSSPQAHGSGRCGRFRSVPVCAWSLGPALSGPVHLAMLPFFRICPILSASVRSCPHPDPVATRGGTRPSEPQVARSNRAGTARNSLSLGVSAQASARMLPTSRGQ
jgi:hypothetical protein